MVNCNLMIILLVGVLKVCTAYPFSSEEDVARVYTVEELQQANIFGISEDELVSGKSIGFTLDEMIKLQQLENPPIGEDATFEFVTKVCGILVYGHKMTSNYTAAQANDLKFLTEFVHVIPHRQYLPFVRTQLCGYVSQPDLLDPKFFSLLRIRFNAMDILSSAEVMCCIDEGGNRVEGRRTELSNQGIDEFSEVWNSFDSVDVPKSMKNLCDFLHSKNLDLASRCVKSSVPVIVNAKK